MRILFAAAVPLGLGACAPLEPLPLAAAPAAFADLPVPNAPAGPAVAYNGYRVVQPADWRGVNDAQAED